MLSKSYTFEIMYFIIQLTEGMDCTDVCSSKWIHKCGAFITATWGRSELANTGEHSFDLLNTVVDHISCILLYQKSK